MRTYLISKGIDDALIDPLSGGVANFLFHITRFDHQMLIVKHAQPYVKLAPFPTTCMFNESKVLEYVGMFEERKSYVTVPRVESYDAENDFDIAIVDWSSNATDVRQFAAEAILLDRTRGKRGLFLGFLEGYKSMRAWCDKY